MNFMVTYLIQIQLIKQKQCAVKII